ncbi:MAG: 16S rRNA (cytosine(967)-C(5))-methyltransferase RsmB [Pyrinomonadaceae bacterium]|nr:16S rRNA (cytosine(967)-C(5))-methyltransferase RsmB [Pyrinomonadaceae bacterium]
MSGRAKSARRPPKLDNSSRNVSPARRAAFEILRRVEEEDAFATVLLAAIDEEMRGEDRALCYEIVLGTLRWQLWLDALIEHYAGRGAEKIDRPVRRALRIGLYQLRFLTRIPVSASVNESVNLAYLARLHSAAGFINAVLRRAVREIDYNPTAKIDDALQRLAIETSHPAWLLERWTKAFGSEETEKFARSNNEAPPVAFRLTAKAFESGAILDELREGEAVITPSEIAPDAWRVVGAGATVRKLVSEGLIYLQDEASQLVAHVVDARQGERILDVCAAPGSKTTHIAARAPATARVVACDLYEHRLRTVLETAKRTGEERIDALAHDATATLPFTAQSFDCVLVDAPCTGTGTLRRNPEIRWRISELDIAELAQRQRRILANAADAVRGGGRLVYSTCSVEPEENEEVIASFLKDHTSFKQVNAGVPEVLRRADGSTARTWPHRDGADGFFIAVFERQT